MKTLSLLAVSSFIISNIQPAIAEICDGTAVTYHTDDTGTITSLDYPNDYLNNELCYWEVTTVSGGNIILTVDNMDIQDTTNCFSDFLEFDNGYDHDEEWVKLCGADTNVVVAGTRDKAYIIFRSNHATVGSGFTLSWTAGPAPTNPPTDPPTTPPAPTALSADVILIIAIAAGSAVGLAIIIGIACCCCNKSCPCYCKKNSSQQQMNRREVSSAWRDERSMMKRSHQVQPAPTDSVDKPPPVDPNTYMRFDAAAIAPAPKKPVAKAEAKPITPKEPKPVLPHIMISYQWDVKPQVLEFREKLKEAGYRVWIDVEQMHKNTSTFDSMAKAIQHSAVVIPVLTEKYQQSVNCRKEIEYADRLKVRLLPITLQENFHPDLWLGFLLGHTTSHNFANPNVEETEMDRFFTSLSQLAESAKKKPAEESEEEDAEEGD